MSYSRPTLTVDFSFDSTMGKYKLTISSSHNEIPENENHFLTECSVYKLVHSVSKTAKFHKYHLELANGCSEALICAVQHSLKHAPIEALEAKINAVEKQIYPSPLRKLLETYESELSAGGEQKLNLDHATKVIIDIYKLPDLIRQHNENVNASLYDQQEAKTLGIGSLFLTVGMISAAAIMWYCWPILPLTKLIIVSCFGGIITGGLFGTICELTHQLLICSGCVPLPPPSPNSHIELGRLLEFSLEREQLKKSSSTSRFLRWFLIPRINSLTPSTNGSSAEQTPQDLLTAPPPPKSLGPARAMPSPQSFRR